GYTVGVRRNFFSCAGVAEMADAPGSKSPALHWACGVDPPLQHQVRLDLIGIVIGPSESKLHAGRDIRRRWRPKGVVSCGGAGWGGVGGIGKQADSCAEGKDKRARHPARPEHLRGPLKPRPRRAGRTPALRSRGTNKGV